VLTNLTWQKAFSRLKSALGRPSQNPSNPLSAAPARPPNWAQNVHWVRVLQLGLFTAAVLLALSHAAHFIHLGFVHELDSALTDALLHKSSPAKQDQRIVIVDVDEKSLAEVGQWPWGRDRLAALVDELIDRQKAAVVGFDFVFAEPDNSGGWQALQILAGTDPELAKRLSEHRSELDHDAQLVRALQNRDVVLGFYLTSNLGGHRSGRLPEPVSSTAKPSRPTGLIRFDGYTANLQSLTQATPWSGFFNALPDADGLVRSLPLLAQVEAQIQQSLALAMFRAYTGAPRLSPRWADESHPHHPDEVRRLAGVELLQKDTRLFVPTDHRGAVRVPYRGAGGPHGGGFLYISATDVLKNRLPAEQLKGKLVLLGTTAPGLFDLRATPVSEAFPGVEMHANVLAGLLDGKLPLQPDWARAFELAQVMGVALLLASILPRAGALVAVITAVLTILSLITLNWFLYRWHSWVMPLAGPLLLAAGVSTVQIAWGYVNEGRTRSSLTRLFGAYVPPELVAQMAQEPERYDMRAENRELTILFCDMRNFTRISESLEPEVLRGLINRFFSTMTQAIQAHRGTLDKYIGDAIMAFWGAPLVDPDHASHAVSAALEMVERLRVLNADLRAQGLVEMGLGLGLNTGLVCVGDMGSDIRRSYTVMGDAVNTASRIEALTRHYDIPILVGQAVRDLIEQRSPASEPAFVWLEIDKVRVKGKTQSVTLFTPLPIAALTSAVMQAQMRFWQEALAVYRLQDWDNAENLLDSLQKDETMNSPASGFLNMNGLQNQLRSRISHNRKQPPPPDWDGTYSFDSK
jgi:adenylate cyclase